MEDKFEPVVELQEEEVASIAAIMSHPGFIAYNKVWRSAVDNFVVQLLNVPLENEAKILKLHMASKLIAQLFTTVVNNVNEKVHIYVNSRPSDKPLDVTANLDLGGIDYNDNIGEEPLF